MPSFSAQAWIGGPFSNNSYFGEGGDDGVYEAAASTINGIGLFRITVGNEFFGFESAVPPVGSGNVVIGAYSSGFTNIWYYEGVFYAGVAYGSASSVSGTVTGFAEAKDDRGMGGNTLTSFFVADFVGGGKYIPARVFNGIGDAQIGTLEPFQFGVYGSKVSNNIRVGF